MIGTMVCLAAVSLGIDVGWEPSEDGKGLEYIIQIEPEMLDSLRAGQPIRSDLRSDLGQIRSYRIQVGNTPVPKTSLPRPPVVEAPKPLIAATKEAPPATLPPDGNSKPIAKPADYQESSPVGKTETAPGATSPGSSEDYFTPMLALAGTSVGLLAALLYLAWIHVGTRNRYHALLAEHMTAGRSPATDSIDRSRHA
jgi:hypothetical protein